MAISEEKMQEMINAAVQGALAAAKNGGNGSGAVPAQSGLFAAPAAGAAGGFGAQPAQPVASTTLPAPEAVLVPMQYNYGDKATLSLYLMFPGSLVPNLDALAALCEGVRNIPGVRVWRPENKNGAGFRSR